jgi:hypothetical protein
MISPGAMSSAARIRCPIDHLINRIALQIGALFNIALHLFRNDDKTKRKETGFPARFVG